MWNDMPPGVDPDSVLGGGFIPPPPGAVQGGQPGTYSPFPGASQPSASIWPTAPTSDWSPATNNVPTWLAEQQPPPSTAQNWTYGQYPPPTPLSSWTTATPAGSWGAGTPAGSWGPPTPASANALGSPWVQQTQPSYFTPATQESAFGQPITANSYFNTPGGGIRYSNTAGTGESGGDSRTKKSKRRRSLHQQQQYPTTQHHMQINPLQRSNSHDPTRPHNNHLQHSLSFGHNIHSFPGYPQQEEYNARNLARRPRDWRPDYDPRPGIASYIPRVGKNRSDVTEWTDPVRRTFHPLLLYNSQNPPIYHDMRENPFQPNTLEFLHLQRAHNDLDYAQLATHPSATELRLYHPRLPWYIHVMQSHPNGVTVYDVLVQMHQQLFEPITMRHWFNEELDDAIRAKMTVAFQERCEDDPAEVAKGVKKVDFLRRRVVFEGLARGKNGLWEIKTRKVE